MYNTIESFIKHHGWTKTARINYLVTKHIKGGQSKDQIKETSLDEYKIFPNERSFNSTWNYYERISDSIKWVSE
tara:strand:- start:2190 stop:2411 length:222 start_codon:yes stop_codon:yes gene_type:complete